MGLRLFLLRWTALVAFSVWFGGFTFYSAAVLPVLHDTLGGLEAGGVTREVAATLNLAGAVALGLWWGLVAAEWSHGAAPERWGRVALLAADTAVLVALFPMYRVLAARLDKGSLRAFYPLHQVYLIASTAQWGINLALLAVSVRIWQRAEGRREDLTAEGAEGAERKTERSGGKVEIG